MTKESAGQALTAAVQAEALLLDLELDVKEVEFLARAATAADRIAELEAIIAVEGSTYTNPKTGVVFPSPLLSEVRLQNAVLLRALRAVNLDAQQTTANGKNLQKSKAGRASWAARSARYGVKQIGSPLNGTNP